MKYASPEKDERSILKYYMQRYLNSEWVLECSLCAWVKEFVESRWLQKFKPIQEETLSEATDEPKDDKKLLRKHLLLLLF